MEEFPGLLGVTPWIKEAEGKILKLCYEGKPVHIVDGMLKVYCEIPRDKG